MSPSLRETLDGLLLGDGNLWACATRPRANSCYQQSSISADWLNRVAAAFVQGGYRAVVTFDRTHQHRDGETSRIWRLRTNAAVALTEQRVRWYPAGRKRVPMDFVLTPEVVRQWYFGDGTLRRGRFVQFCSEAYTREEIDWLVAGLEGVVGRGLVRTETRRAGWNIVLTRGATLHLLDVIGPEVPRSLAHKFRVRAIERPGKLKEARA